MNAAIYHRVSTVDQNPALARAELRAAAARLDTNVVLSIEEKGSGARNDRPGLQRILETARRGEVDAVLCWKLDRFGRSVLDVLSSVRALEAACVRFIVTTVHRHHPGARRAPRRRCHEPPHPQRAGVSGRVRARPDPRAHAARAAQGAG